MCTPTQIKTPDRSSQVTGKEMSKKPDELLSRELNYKDHVPRDTSGRPWQWLVTEQALMALLCVLFLKLS